MSSVRLFKYSGAGNDFIVLADGFEPVGHDGVLAGDFGSEGTVSAALPEEASGYGAPEVIRRLCDRRTGFKAADGRIGADGLMMLSPSADADFRMEYYNSDGSGGMMCGNGGRCIVAFADFLGIRPAEGKAFVFEAPDGLHTGEILSRNGSRCIVRLKMIDAFGLKRVLGGWFLNTGTRHFVLFTDDVEAVDVAAKGAELRWNPEFSPEGANVNFVSPLPDGSLKIRTFEKGVEAETLACGTGITAAAIAAWNEGIPPAGQDGDIVRYRLHARTDGLSVDFRPAGGFGRTGQNQYAPAEEQYVVPADLKSDGTEDSRPREVPQPGVTASDVYLTGPAERTG